MDSLLNELNNPPVRWIAVCLVSWMVGSVATLLWLRVANRARQAAQDPATPLHQALTSLTISISQQQDRLEQEIVRLDATITKILKGCAEQCLRLENIETYLDSRSRGVATCWGSAAPPSASASKSQLEKDMDNLDGSYSQEPTGHKARAIVESINRARSEQFPDGTRLEVT